MRGTELDLVAIKAIDARKKGVSPEDDYVEVKRQWPDETWFRQLAGLANRAAGEPVVLIVGMDDKTGEIADPGATEPANWWPRYRKHFDGEPPEMVRHRLVDLGDGRRVHAVAFLTDGAPYVVKVGNDTRDVPMREGTRTRSAYRAELLRLLIPSVGIPPTILLSASMQARWRLPEAEQVAHSAEGAWYGSFGLFAEHVREQPVMFPTHAMRGTIIFGSTMRPLEISPPTAPVVVGDQIPQGARLPSSYGAEVRHDGVVVTGPAAFGLVARAGLSPADAEAIDSASFIDLKVRLGVAGGAKPVLLDARLTRRAPAYALRPPPGRGAASFQLPGP